MITPYQAMYIYTELRLAHERVEEAEHMLRRVIGKGHTQRIADREAVADADELLDAQRLMHKVSVRMKSVALPTFDLGVLCEGDQTTRLILELSVASELAMRAAHYFHGQGENEDNTSEQKHAAMADSVELQEISRVLDSVSSRIRNDSTKRTVQ